MRNWLQKLFGKKPPPNPDEEVQPMLLQARDLADSDIGRPEWNSAHNADHLTVSNNGQTIEWAPRDLGSEELDLAWVPASTHLQLHSGRFRWDFVVDEMASRQIGVGFMLLWNLGPDWGFYGYLGASPTAWSYDPTTGDVVCATESIQGGLPKFERGGSGVVSVELNVPRDEEGEGKFIVDGTESRPIPLPSGAVVLPAACLLEKKQRITLARFKRL